MGDTDLAAGVTDRLLSNEFLYEVGEEVSYRDAIFIFITLNIKY